MSLASYHCSTPGCVSFALALAAAVAAEEAGRGELPQLVADHVLRDEQLDELPAVVHQERVADEVGYDGAVAGPGLQRVTVGRPLLALDLGQQALIDVRPFLQRTAHGT